PSGDKLAYVQLAGSTSRLMISGERLGTSNDVFPFFSTWLTENQLLYTADGKIRVTDIAAGETREIPFRAKFVLNRPPYSRKRFDLDSPGARTVKGIVGPALSPDGKQVVFQALNQLWHMRIGEKPQAITSDSFYKEDPAWSPDGRKIAYCSDKAGSEDIYI